MNFNLVAVYYDNEKTTLVRAGVNVTLSYLKDQRVTASIFSFPSLKLITSTKLKSASGILCCGLRQEIN